MREEDLEGMLLPEYLPQTARMQIGIPKRDIIISIDEIRNLVILLNTTNDVNEFLRRI